MQPFQILKERTEMADRSIRLHKSGLSEMLIRINKKASPSKQTSVPVADFQAIWQFWLTFRRNELIMSIFNGLIRRGCFEIFNCRYRVIFSNQKRNENKILNTVKTAFESHYHYPVFQVRRAAFLVFVSFVLFERQNLRSSLASRAPSATLCFELSINLGAQ